MIRTTPSEEKRGRSLLLSVFTVTMALVLLLAGCGQSPGARSAETPPAGIADQITISSKPAETKVTLTLYFSDDQAMYLQREQREVLKKNETLEELVLNELMKGPKKSGFKVIPDKTKLLSVSVVDSIAFVNFSKEFQSNHWGGSTGETHTVYAIVNSLCELEGINQVQFMIEGSPLETLGHMDLTKPVLPDTSMMQ